MLRVLQFLQYAGKNLTGKGSEEVARVTLSTDLFSGFFMTNPGPERSGPGVRVCDGIFPATVT